MLDVSASVAQLDRAGGFYPPGCGFDSCRGHQPRRRPPRLGLAVDSRHPGLAVPDLTVPPSCGGESERRVEDASLQCGLSPVISVTRPRRDFRRNRIPSARRARSKYVGSRELLTGGDVTNRREHGPSTSMKGQPPGASTKGGGSRVFWFRHCRRRSASPCRRPQAA